MPWCAVMAWPCAVTGSADMTAIAPRTDASLHLTLFIGRLRGKSTGSSASLLRSFPGGERPD